MLDFLKKNKGIAAVAVALLLAFVALSAVRCTSVHAERLQEGQEARQQAQDGAEEKPREGEAPAHGQAEAEPEPLPGDIADARASHDDRAREIDAFLAANAWTSAGDSSTLSFSGGRMLEEKPGQNAVETPYAVAAVSGDGSLEKTQAGAAIKRTSIALQTPDKTRILLLTETTDPAGGASWILSADAAFAYAPAYNRAAASATFTVEGLTSEAVALLGGDANAIGEALRDYCAQYYPTATRAKWTAQAAIDWTGAVADTSFVLDNSSKTQLTLSYRMDGKSIEVGKVG